MIPRTLNAVETSDWKTLLSQSSITLYQLCEYLNIPYDPLAELAHKEFPLRVPEPYLKKIRKGDINDPLLLQILPQLSEVQTSPEFTKDPLNEADYNPVPGIIHKYSNRILLINSSTCAINCRYCFRKHFPYEHQRRSKKQWAESIDYIRNNPLIYEVIMSGGDPLTMTNAHLREMLDQISTIPHIKRVRIHSRLPIVLPQRIDASFIDIMESFPLQKIMVLHSNHPNEIDQEVGLAIRKLTSTRTQVFNQTVLLRGINDQASILAELNEKLFEYGAIPYYLHLLDKVKGTKHFDIEQTRAQEIMRELLKILPGFLIPRLVREIPEKPSKTWIHF